MGGNKYGARKTVGYDGMGRVFTFDSAAEARRNADLVRMEIAGEISLLERQVEYLLVPKQTGERAVTYRADFRYMRDGQLVVEDVKGMKTPEYIIKRKLMLWIQGTRIVEVA